MLMTFLRSQHVVMLILHVFIFSANNLYRHSVWIILIKRRIICTLSWWFLMDVFVPLNVALINFILIRKLHFSCSRQHFVTKIMKRTSSNIHAHWGKRKKKRTNYVSLNMITPYWSYSLEWLKPNARLSTTTQQNAIVYSMHDTDSDTSQHHLSK